MPKILHIASLICCGFIIVSFLLFAVHATSHASQGATASLGAGPAPTSVLNASGRDSTSHQPETQPRRFIDAVAHDLESPFEQVVDTDNAWVGHLVPAGIALLLYGLALSYLARWTAVRS